jgi:hypothetical protein
LKESRTFPELPCLPKLLQANGERNRKQKYTPDINGKTGFPPQKLISFSGGNKIAKK